MKLLPLFFWQKNFHWGSSPPFLKSAAVFSTDLRTVNDGPCLYCNVEHGALVFYCSLPISLVPRELSTETVEFGQLPVSCEQ